MRRIAFGGLVLIGAAVAAGLVLWLAIFTVHENRASGAATATARLTATVAPPLRHAPSVQAATGSTCFVSGQECSETPCTEMIGSTMSLATVSRATVSRATVSRATVRSATARAPSVSGLRLETPVSGCGPRRTQPHARLVTQGRLQVVSAHNPYPRILESLRARLSRRFP